MPHKLLKPMHFQWRTFWPLVTFHNVTATYLLGIWYTLGRPLKLSLKWIGHIILDNMWPTSNLTKSNFKRLLWPWEWSQGQTCGMSWKALSRGVTWYINTGLSVQTLCHTAISFPYWFILEWWTLAHNSEAKGHSDLILWLQGHIDQRCSDARLEGYRFIRAKLCQPRCQN